MIPAPGLSVALAEAIAAGATVITPTRRLARHVVHQFDAHQMALGRPVWGTADVLPWDAWIERVFETEFFGATDCPFILNQNQEIELWRSLIRSTHPAADMAALGHLARDAWRLQHDWRLALSVVRADASADVQAYAMWSGRLASTCRDQNWVTRAQIADRLLMQPLVSLRGHRLLFFCFDVLTPQQRALLEACARAGAEVSESGLEPGTRQAVQRIYDDPAQECAAVAAQASDLLRVDPGLRIGIVAPDLSMSRTGWVRALEVAFDPACQLTAAGREPLAYNVSLGLPLSEWPPARALLSCLRLGLADMSLNDIGDLLLSPFVGGAQAEYSERAQFDASLRERGGLIVGLDEFARLVGAFRAARNQCVALAEAVVSFQASTRDLRGRRMPSQWATVFSSLLDALGWPGDRPLDSVEAQVVERLRIALRDLSMFDIITGRLRAAEAFARLAQMLSETIFQPESADVPVQVLGLLESAGLEFDHLFVTGLTDQAWPAPPRPNPLLPIRLQRSLGVPHASHEWERDFAQRMMHMWSGMASHIQFSSARRSDGRPLRPSALLRSVRLQTDSGGAPSNPYHDAMLASARIENVCDPGAPLVDTELPLRGGAALFKDQSACPFRAMAVHRLDARELEAGRVGLDARDRGVLVHAVLDAYARRVTSAAQLRELQEPELGALLDAAVQEGLSVLLRRRSHLMPEAFQVTEAARLRTLLEQFVATERQRAPYRVTSRESAEGISIKDLTVTGRPDRIDAIESPTLGSLLAVIDYKTGQVSVRDWFGERPREPQLPMYVLAQTAPVGVVAFVGMRAGHVQWNGIAREDGLAPGVRQLDVRTTGDPTLDSFDAVQSRWREVLERLATQYLTGRADVDPRNGRATCRYCHLETLCRIDTASQDPEPDHDDDE